jgi:hypothetical protein
MQNISCKYDTFLRLFKCVMVPKGFIIYLNRGSACALSNFWHKQYPSNNLDQKNSIHGVYRIPPWGYYVHFKFC